MAHFFIFLFLASAAAAATAAAANGLFNATCNDEPS
jgi:hypothetical protein